MHPAEEVRPDSASLKLLIRTADQCRSPRKFRALIDQLHEILPYRHFLCAWGYLPDYKIGFIYNHTMPETFLRWSLTKRLVRNSPMFQEWFRTRRVQIWPDVARQDADRFIPGAHA